LFGAGKDGLRALNTLRSRAIEPYAFCDNSPKVVGTEIHGVKVISFEQLKELSMREEACVLITTSNFYHEVKQQLASSHIAALNG